MMLTRQLKQKVNFEFIQKIQSFKLKNQQLSALIFPFQPSCQRHMLRQTTHLKLYIIGR